MYDEYQDMISYPQSVTGVTHTIFISTKGHSRHGPRIKVAIDPPDRLDPRHKVATVDLKGLVVTGKLDPAILNQARRFIDLNRTVLIQYWSYEIDTEELRRQLKAI